MILGVNHIHWQRGSDRCHTPRVKPSGVALLLSQLGAHVSGRFAERLAELDLSPTQVGVLRIVGQQPGLNQQELARRLGAAPSRVVTLVDDLEARGLVQRRRKDTDRRHYALEIAPGAEERMAAVRAAVWAHDAEITQPLTAQEVTELHALLSRVAAAQGLEPSGHPAYRGTPVRTDDHDLPT